MSSDGVEQFDVVDLLMSYRARQVSRGAGGLARTDLDEIRALLETSAEDAVERLVADTERIRQGHHAFDLARDLMSAGDVDRAKHWLSVAAELGVEEAASLFSDDIVVEPSPDMSRQRHVDSDTGLPDAEGSILQALIRARENADLALRDSEARFEEIFGTAPIGMAISDLDGVLVRTNSVLAKILGHRGRIAVDKLEELFHPEDADYLKLRYEVLLEESSHPFRERRRLRRADGGEALVFLAASVLRDPDGTPRYFVTSAEDVSARHFLEGQLRFQATHDALTGLANRRLFVHRLEETLTKRPTTHGITLFHLNLDGFRAINNGLGRDAGDRLLQAVSARLAELFAEETTVIARLDGDEFAVLLENGPNTPSFTSVASRITDDLAEPVYIGDHGIAATVTIAVLPDPPAGSTPEELLRTTDISLSRLKAAGRRQWGVVDPRENDHDQARLALAGSLPGAWECGELSLTYQPLVSVADHSVVAMQPLLRWNHTERGPLDHQQCLAVLAETGMSIPIGRWVLSTAAEQLRTWIDQNRAGTKLYVELTKELAGDADLVSAVHATLMDNALSAKQLRLGMPVQALCTNDSTAEDNLDVLVDLGLSVVLYGFGTTSGDLACLEDLPVQAVKMAGRVVSRVDRMGDDALFTRAIRQLVPLVHETGVPVIVGDIATRKQLNWWRKVGADTVQGTYQGLTEHPHKVGPVRMHVS